MAQVTGFLKRVYKIHKLWQLEDVNLKTELNPVHFQGEYPAFQSARGYTATRKSRSSHMKLERNRLLPNQRLIAFPKRKDLVIFSHKQVDSEGEFQRCYFHAASAFIHHRAAARGHADRSLEALASDRRPPTAPQLSRIHIPRRPLAAGNAPELKRED